MFDPNHESSVSRHIGAIDPACNIRHIAEGASTELKRRLNYKCITVNGSTLIVSRMYNFVQAFLLYLVFRFRRIFERQVSL